MTPDLSTRYLGLQLESPFIASSSPLTGDLASLARLVEAGASAVVLPSLFEEQIEHEERTVDDLHTFATESFAEAQGFFPELDDYNAGPESYLALVEEASTRLPVPVIASLNGSTAGGWVRYAELIERAGAAALELNVYFVPTDFTESADDVERRYTELVAAVRQNVSIPLAVKLGPYFSSLPSFAGRLVEAGADGLVLFNRFLQPDLDLDRMQVVPSLELSSSYESRLALLWIAILKGRVSASFAATGGVHTAEDALKLLLAGADAMTLASSLLLAGPDHLRTLLTDVRAWMSVKEYESIEQLKGSMSHANCPDPTGYERGNYMRTLLSYTGHLI